MRASPSSKRACPRPCAPPAPAPPLPIRELEEEASRKAAGADAEEIRSYRVATVGEAAANRLEALDAERAEWNKRLSAYQAARAKIAGETSDPAARKDAETKLLEASFTPQEQLRVKALDEIAAGAPPASDRLLRLSPQRARSRASHASRAARQAWAILDWGAMS